MSEEYYGQSSLDAVCEIRELIGNWCDERGINPFGKPVHLEGAMGDPGEIVLCVKAALELAEQRQNIVLQVNHTHKGRGGIGEG